MSKTKVMLVPQAEVSKNGGVWRHCLSLSHLFQNDDTLEVDIIDTNKIPVKILPLPGKKYCYSFKALYNYLKNESPDIIHPHGFISFSSIQTFIICLLLRKKVVYSPHFHPFKYLEHPWLAKIFYKILISPFKKVISNVVTINLTDTSFFKSRNWAVTQIPHHYTNNSNTIISEKQSNAILFVGRNDNNKGVDYLNYIPANYELHCVTDRKDNITRRNVHFHSSICDEQLNSLYNKASLVIIPSRYEAFSYVALEALNCGTPVLASDNVEIGSYLNQVEGFTTFKFGDYKDFLRKIPIAMKSDVETQKIRDIFSPNTIKEQYKELYLSICR